MATKKTTKTSDTAEAAVVESTATKTVTGDEEYTYSPFVLKAIKETRGQQFVRVWYDVDGKPTSERRRAMCATKEEARAILDKVYKSTKFDCENVSHIKRNRIRPQAEAETAEVSTETETK